MTFEEPTIEDIEERVFKLKIEKAALAFLNPAPFEMKAVHSIDDISRMPEAEFLLPDYIVKGGRTLLAASAGSYKSFLAIDWACSLAAKGYKVAYFALEGQYTLKGRVGAWRAEHPFVDLKPYLCFPEVNIAMTSEENIDGLVGWLTSHCPFDLVVIDNLNRAGLDDEGGTSPSAALAVRALDRIVEVAGSVVAIHNFGWGGNRMRGPSKIRDGMDTVVYLHKGVDNVVRVTCDKQKSFEEFEPRYFRLKDIPGTKSAVVEMCEGQDSVEDNPAWLALLESENGLTLQELFNDTGVSRATLQRRLDEWVEARLITRTGTGRRNDAYRWTMNSFLLSAQPLQIDVGRNQF